MRNWGFKEFAKVTYQLVAEFGPSHSDSRVQPLNQDAVMPLQVRLSDLLLIKLHVGQYSSNFWASVLSEGPPCRQCEWGMWNGGRDNSLQEQDRAAAPGPAPSKKNERNLSRVRPVCCFQHCLPGMMQGKTENREEPLSLTGSAQEAQESQGEKGLQSPGRKKFRTVQRP